MTSLTATHPTQPPSEFVFATCVPTSNEWLKRDVTRLHPELRLAFSRPGFVSWKGERLDMGFEIRSPIAITSGWGCGQAKTIEQVGAKVVGLLNTLNTARIHVYGLRPEDVSEVMGSVKALDVWFASMGKEVTVNVAARARETVVDVVVLGPEQWFVGWHAHSATKYGGPGGVTPTPIHERSPSRAYSKVAELLCLGELILRPENTVVELGAAPGGATLFLLQQGARVWAVDPAPLADEVVAFGKLAGNALVTLRATAGEVVAAQLPKRPDYLVSDVNLAPSVSLRYLERLCAMTKGPKKAVLVNFKINDEKAEVMLQAVLTKTQALGQRHGLSLMRVAQVPSHRREVGVVLRRPNVK